MRASPFYIEMLPGWRARAKGSISPYTRRDADLHPSIQQRCVAPESFSSVDLDSLQLIVTKVDLEAAGAEVKRVKQKVGKQSSSILAMSKAELVELARIELGMKVAEPEKSTVTILKERLRSHRDMLNTVMDPLDVVPKGGR